MKTVYHVDGKQIIRTFNPNTTYQEIEVAAYCDDPQKALTMMLRAWGLNEDRKYTASSRLFAQVADLPGFAWALPEN